VNGGCPEHVRVRAGALASGRLLFMGTTSTEEEVLALHRRLKFPWVSEKVRRHVAVFFLELHNGQTYYQSLRTDSYELTGLICDSWESKDIRPADNGVILPHPQRREELYVPYDPLTIAPGLGGKEIGVDKVGDISQLVGGKV